LPIEVIADFQLPIADLYFGSRRALNSIKFFS
jgi:hypothetical protein